MNKQEKKDYSVSKMPMASELVELAERLIQMQKEKATWSRVEKRHGGSPRSVNAKEEGDMIEERINLIKEMEVVTQAIGMFTDKDGVEVLAHGNIDRVIQLRLTFWDRIKVIFGGGIIMKSTTFTQGAVGRTSSNEAYATTWVWTEIMKSWQRKK
jgi:hypothetical protein